MESEDRHRNPRGLEFTLAGYTSVANRTTIAMKATTAKKLGMAIRRSNAMA